MIRKIINVPGNYKRQYVYVVLGLVAIVGFNATFLYIPTLSIFNFLDYSVWGYGVALFVVYWTVFIYSKRGMLNYFRYTIFNNIDQGIILFDYNDSLVLKNDKVSKIFPEVEFFEEMTVQQFLNSSETEISVFGYEPFSVQCYLKMEKGVRPVRADYQPILNKKNEITGRLFVFTESDMDTDLLSGFQNWKSFSETGKTEERRS